MKTVKTLLFVSVLFLLTAESCAQKAVEGVTAAQIDSVSYALGMNIGQSLKQSKLEMVDLNVFLKGVTDVLNEKDLRFEDRQAVEIIRGFITKRMDYVKTKNLADGRAFLDNNKKDADVVTLESGLQYKILTPGTGAKPAAVDTVKVNYRGTLIDGREFDSSEKNGGQPAEFPLNGVIKGWTEGLQQLNEGSKAILYVPADLAYGEHPYPGSIIEPNAALIFEIELLEVKPAAPATETPEPAQK
jgi:FKBP-type peptidyl-prolyl cis-trans isomerase FklB